MTRTGNTDDEARRVEFMEINCGGRSNMKVSMQILIALSIASGVLSVQQKVYWLAFLNLCVVILLSSN